MSRRRVEDIDKSLKAAFDDAASQVVPDRFIELLAKLRAIDPSVYIYGEGWNFGEVGNDTRFIQACR